MGTLSYWIQASILFLLIMLGWVGDTFLSVAIGRPRLSFREVYGSWRHNHLLCRTAGK